MDYEIQDGDLFYNRIFLGRAEGDFAVVFDAEDNSLMKHGRYESLDKYYQKIKASFDEFGYTRLVIMSFPINKINIEVVNTLIEHPHEDILTYLSTHLYIPH